MRKLKNFSILFIIALTVISFFCPIMAYAEEESPTPKPPPTPVPTPAPSELDKMQEELDKIYDYLNSLDRQPAPTYPPEPTEKPVAAPLVKVLSPQTITLYAGSITDTEITLKNVGTSHASSVLTQAVTTGDPGFSMTFLNGSNSISSIGQNGETNVLMRFITDKTAKPGTYTIEITNSFRDMYGVNHTEKDSINVKVENSGYGAGMFLKDFSGSSDSLTPGSTFTLSLKLINGSPFEMTGARIEIEGIKPEGINMTGTSGVFRSSVPSGHEETLSYQFSAAKRAREGSYPLTFTLNYNDPSGEQRSTAYTYYVRVVSAGDTDDEQGTANVEIVSLQSPSGIFEVGETFGVELSIRNTGDAAARRVSVKADGGEAIMPVSASIKLVNRLPAGESETMQFYFAASEAAKSQYHMIHFTLSYETGNYETNITAENNGTSISNETITVDQYAGVNVNNPPEPSQTPEPSPDPAKINKPKMIISSYKTDPAIVSAGKSFKLSLDFQNTHKTKTVSNLKIVITATESSGEAGSIFSPLDSGNTVFISDIPPGGIVNKTMTMITAPDAQPRSYALSVKFIYQDDEFLEHEEEEQIGITVKQAIRLEINDLVLPSDGFAGEPLMLYCNIINSGRASLGNLRVRVESEELETAGAGAYMGTLSEGSSTYYEGMITPLTSGAVKGVLIVSGEDASGEITELRQDFEVQIQDYGMDMGMELDNMEMFPEPVELGLFEKLQVFLAQFWMWAAAGAVLFIVIIVIILKIVKNRRKQRSWETNE